MAGQVYRNTCVKCGVDVEVTRIEGREGYWWRCRSCGWTFPATRYDEYLMARAELAAAWRRFVDRVLVPLLGPLTRRGGSRGRAG